MCCWERGLFECGKCVCWGRQLGEEPGLPGCCRSCGLSGNWSAQGGAGVEFKGGVLGGRLGVSVL